MFNIIDSNPIQQTQYYNNGTTPMFDLNPSQQNYQQNPQFNYQQNPQQNYQQNSHLNLDVNNYINNINSNDVTRDMYGNIISYNVHSYKGYDSMRDQMYDIPDMYIGSTSHDVRKVQLLNYSNPKELFIDDADSSI